MGFFGDLLGTLLPGTSGLERLSAVLTAFATAITDGKMWRSFGWLLLGILLIAAGLIWIIKGPVNQKLDLARAAAAKAA